MFAVLGGLRAAGRLSNVAVSDCGYQPVAGIKEQDARVCCNARFGRDHDRRGCVLRTSAQLAVRDGLCDGRFFLPGVGLAIG